MIREFILKNKIFSKCSAFEQAQIMNELDDIERLTDEYNNMVLDNQKVKDDYNYLLNKYRLLERQLSVMREREDKRWGRPY